jgi:hypothetical protein
MVTVTLEKLDENRTVLETMTFLNFKTWGITLGFPIVDVPLPQEDQKERILLKLLGNTSDTKFSWTVKDEVVTVVAGRDIKTMDQQIDFWRAIFRPTSIIDNYRFTINFPTPVVFEGTMNSVRFDMTDGSPVSMTGSFNFMEGKVNGGVFEQDPPSPPKNVTVSSPGAGDLKQDWSASGDPGNSSVSFWNFEYRLEGSATWTVISVAVGNFTHTKTGLATGTYQTRMRGANTAGDGQPSPTLLQAVA